MTSPRRRFKDGLGERFVRVGRVRRGEVTALDVRPPEECRAGHIPRTISIPVDELKARRKELPRGRGVAP